MGLAAIGAAGALALGGATAIGATATAIAAGTLTALNATAVFAAIGTVGAVLGAVGAVTGVKELKTAGMVIGAIGGIGALASSVGAFGQGATVGSIFGGAETAAVGGAQTVGASGAGSFFDAEAGVFTDNAGSLINGGAGASADIITSANGIGNFQSVGDMEGLVGMTSPAAPTTPVAANAPSATAPAAAAGGMKAPLAMQPKAAEAGGTEMAADPAKSGWEGPNKNPILGEEFTNPVSGAKYRWDGTKQVSVPSFWGGNTGALLGMGVLQAGGSFLEGAFDETKPAQAASYLAQAEANNAQAAINKRELSNMSGNLPVARRTAVTGRVAGNGLINQAGAAV